MKKAELKTLVAELQESNESLSKQYESEKKTCDMYRRNCNEAEKVIEEMHQMFDGLENCPRETDDGRGHYCGKLKLSLSARFARYLQTLVLSARQS